VSRYEWDSYRYPTQFIRSKKDSWTKLYRTWDKEKREKHDDTLAEASFEEKRHFFSKIKTLIQRKEEAEEPEEEEDTLPESEPALKQYFLDKLFHFQLTWATSTINQISFMDKRFNTDSLLKYLLQRLPDTYFIMYFPIFSIRKAPMDAEIILISPIGIEIIRFAEEQPDSVFMAGSGRSWSVKRENQFTTILSPLISLKRTEKLVNSILNKNDVQFPVQKTILSRTNQIVFTEEPYKTRIIDELVYNQWFQQKRTLTSPLKKTQLQAAEALLKQCETISVRRPEWKEEQEKAHDAGDI